MGPGTLPRITPVELIILISRRGICNADVAIEMAALMPLSRHWDSKV